MKETKENNQIVSRVSRESYSQKWNVTQREENICSSIYTLKINSECTVYLENNIILSPVLTTRA